MILFIYLTRNSQSQQQMLPHTLIASEEVCVWSDDTVRWQCYKTEFWASEDSTGLPLLFRRHFSFYICNCYGNLRRPPGNLPAALGGQEFPHCTWMTNSIHQHVAELVVSPSPWRSSRSCRFSSETCMLAACLSSTSVTLPASPPPCSCPPLCDPPDRCSDASHVGPVPLWWHHRCLFRLYLRPQVETTAVSVCVLRLASCLSVSCSAGSIVAYPQQATVPRTCRLQLELFLLVRVWL